MTIVDDVYYYVVKYEDAKKVIENIKTKLKLEELKQPPKTPLSPLFTTPVPKEETTDTNENDNENADGKHHLRSKSSPIKIVSNISSKAPRSIQRLLVRTGMAPLQAYPELMTRNNLRLIMKPEGLEPDPIIQSATVSNDEFNADDLFQTATTENQQKSFLSRIRSSLGKKKEDEKDKTKEPVSALETVPENVQEIEAEADAEPVLHDNYGSSVALLGSKSKDELTEENTEKNKEESIISSINTATNNSKTEEGCSSSSNSPTNKSQYSQYVIDLGNTAMTNEKTLSPKSAMSSCPYPAYSNNLLQIHTNSYLNDRNNKLSVYDWIKIHSTSPLSANTGVKIDDLFSKKFNNKSSNDGASVSTDTTKKNENDNNNNICITVEDVDEDKENATEKDDLKKNDALNKLKEIIFEAPFYATDDDFLMKSSVRAYFKQNALEPDDAVLFTLPSLVDNVVMLDGEQHPALLNFNYVLDRQMQNEARVLRKINKSLKWLLLAYLVFAFVLIKIWVPTNVVIIIIAIGIFLICFFLMICAI